MVDSINSMSSVPANQVVKKTEDKDEKTLEKAIENNNETAKLCSYVALGTSCATLLPLSVLALKTHKMSKVVEEAGNALKPTLENLKGASEQIKGVTDTVNGAVTELGESVRDISGGAKRKVNELFELVNTEDMKALIDELGEKVRNADTQKVVDSISNLIDELKGTLNNKVDGINPERFNELIDTLNSKLQEVDVSTLSSKAREFLNSLGKSVNT